MNRLYSLHQQLFTRPAARPLFLHARLFSGSAPSLACHSSQETQSSPTSVSCNQNKTSTRAAVPAPLSRSTSSLLSGRFWACRSTWRRAGLNTLRCLAGCSVGDFIALWTLQSYYPDLGMNAIMLAASKFAPSLIRNNIILPGNYSGLWDYNLNHPGNSSTSPGPR